LQSLGEEKYWAMTGLRLNVRVMMADGSVALLMVAVTQECISLLEIKTCG
jgi:hypothetical protein